MNHMQRISLIIAGLNGPLSHAAATSLDATHLFTQTAHDCHALDLATWHHQTRQVLESNGLKFSKVELCNGAKYPIFTIEPKYDPRTATGAYYNKLYSALANANGWHPYALIDTTDNVIITVAATKTPASVNIYYEEFQ